MKQAWCILLSTSIFCGCAKVSYNSMAWQSTMVNVDGLGNEWNFPLTYYDTNTKLAFLVSNDNTTVYLTLSSGDDATAIKAIHSGIKIEIDTGSGKKFPMQIICKSSGNFQHMSQEKRANSSFMENQKDSTGKPIPFRIPSIDMEMIGLKNVPNGIYHANNVYKIHAAITPKDEAGRFFAEIAIPFSVLYKNEISAADTNQLFSIRITLDKMEMPQMDGQKPSIDMNGGPPGGGGGGGMPSGGMPGGGMPSGGGMPGGGMPRGNMGPPPGGGFPGGDNSNLTTKTSFLIILKPSFNK